MGMDQYVCKIKLIPDISKENTLILLTVNGVSSEILSEFRKNYELNDLLGPIIGFKHTTLPNYDANNPGDYDKKRKIENCRLYELTYEPLFTLWESLPDEHSQKQTIYDMMMCISKNDEPNTIICFVSQW